MDNNSSYADVVINFSPISPLDFHLMEDQETTPQINQRSSTALILHPTNSTQLPTSENISSETLENNPPHAEPQEFTADQIFAHQSNYGLQPLDQPASIPNPLALPEVQKMMAKLSNFTLFIRMADTTLNIQPSIILSKVKEHWKGLQGDIEVGTYGTWTMLTFANKEARDIVWANRPYRVQNKLVLLQPFIPDFDPLARIVSHADIWVGIPLLPIFYHNEHALHMIIRGNNIGTFIRMDENSSMKNRGKFVRFCINVTIPEVPGYVKIQHTDNSIMTFKLWSEDFSPGCGCCGELDHLFDDCFLNNLPAYVFEAYLVAYVFEAYLVGSSDDEEAARLTKQKMIGHLTKQLTYAVPNQSVHHSRRGPNFVRKVASPSFRNDESTSKGKSLVNPREAAPIQSIQYPQRSSTTAQENPPNFQLHPVISPELFNTQLMAQMHHFAYAMPPHISMTRSMAPRMIRPPLQNQQRTSVLIHIHPPHVTQRNPVAQSAASWMELILKDKMLPLLPLLIQKEKTSPLKLPLQHQLQRSNARQRARRTPPQSKITCYYYPFTYALSFMHYISLCYYNCPCVGLKLDPMKSVTGH